MLLLDEPFGALDARVRLELRRWLRRLHDEIHVTSVFVTHDQEEALEVADRIVVMNEGRIEQMGTPDEVYDKPANPFVYNFLGNVNLFHGRLEEGRLSFGGIELDCAPGKLGLKPLRPLVTCDRMICRSRTRRIRMKPWLRSFARYARWTIRSSRAGSGGYR